MGLWGSSRSASPTSPTWLGPCMISRGVPACPSTRGTPRNHTQGAQVPSAACPLGDSVASHFPALTARGTGGCFHAFGVFSLFNKTTNSLRRGLCFTCTPGLFSSQSGGMSQRQPFLMEPITFPTCQHISEAHSKSPLHVPHLPWQRPASSCPLGMVPGMHSKSSNSGSKTGPPTIPHQTVGLRRTCGRD